MDDSRYSHGWRTVLATVRAVRAPRAIERHLVHRRRGRPPRRRRGWEIGPPDFVGLGAQRAGTTWWYELLREHPHVFGPRVKELHFFGRPGLEEDAVALAREYARYFPRPPGAIAGEWTPSYLHNRHVPAQVHAAAPDARLLILLRDPVERYRSGVARRPHREADAFRRGFYDVQLRRWLERYPQERILVLQYERCVAEPAAELAKTFEFLGVDPGFTPRRFDQEGAASFSTRYVIGRHLRRWLVRQYEPSVKGLLELGFEIDLSVWPNFSQLAR